MNLTLEIFRNYQSTLNHLRKIEQPGIRLNLEPMRRITARLGEPWKDFPSILIAGTNGKGSTAAMLSEVLADAGYKVGLYTSPHLNSYKERILIKHAGSQTNIDEKVWCANFSKLNQAISEEQVSLTEFEILTALAFLIFQEEKIDAAVLEVGLGGRLDATNVVCPVLSIITSIDHDHHDFLGKNLRSIAGEKAGILRPKTSGVTLAQDPEVMLRLNEEAKKLQARLHVIIPGTLQTISLESQTFNYQGKTYGQTLLGEHQAANASLVVESAKHLKDSGFKISHENLVRGIKKAKWPARCEFISSSPAILIDGAHNPHGCRGLVSTLKKLDLPQPHLLILGVLEGKDIQGMIEALRPWGDSWILTRSFNSKAMDPYRISQAAQSSGVRQQIHCTPRVGEACRQGLALLNNGGTLVVAGSLTTAGEARRIFQGVL